MKYLLHLAIALFLVIHSFAQPVLKRQNIYGTTLNDFFGKIILTKDGGFLNGGTTPAGISGNKTENGNGADDMWIIKTNSAGTQQWDKSIGGSSGDGFTDMQATKDGGYILLSNSSSNISGDKTENCRGSQDYWVVKINSSGAVQWDKTLGSNDIDVPLSIAQTADSGYIVCGRSISAAGGDKTQNNKGGWDIWIVKLDKAGHIQWDKTIGGAGDDGYISSFSANESGDALHAVVCRPAADGGIIIGAVSNSNISGDKTANSRGGYSDYWIIKTDNAGNIQWDKTIGGSGNDYFNALELTADGGYIVGGYSGSKLSVDKTATTKGGYDYWIVKLNSTGAIQWDKTIGGGSKDVLQSIYVTSDNGYLLGGYSRSGKSGNKTEPARGFEDYWIVKTDSLGSVQWNKTIGGDSFDDCYSVLEQSPNVYITGGNSSSGISGDKTKAALGNGDFWIVKLVYKNNQAIPQTIAGKMPFTAKEISAAKLQVYPNPAANVLYIKINEKAVFMLMNEQGKTLISQTIIANGKMNIAHLSTGIYYLKNCTSGEVQKIAVNR